MSDYNLQKIRALLSDGFDEGGLRDLIFFEAPFRPLYRDLRQTDRHSDLVRALLAYAEREGLFEALLAYAYRENPAQYERHQPYRPDGQALEPVAPPPPPPANPQVEQELARLKQALVAQKGLRGILPDEQIEATLASLRQSAGLIVAGDVAGDVVGQDKVGRDKIGRGGRGRRLAGRGGPNQPRQSAPPAGPHPSGGPDRCGPAAGPGRARVSPPGRRPAWGREWLPAHAGSGVAQRGQDPPGFGPLDSR